jgi:hypothetical protein
MLKGLTALMFVVTIKTQITKHSASSVSLATTVLMAQLTAHNVQQDLGRLVRQSFAPYV